MSPTPPARGQGTPNEPDAPPLHVIPDRVGGWRVEREGAAQPLSRHDSETEAEGAAVRAARDTETPDVVIHDRYDRVQRAQPLADEPRTPPRASRARKG